MYCSNCGKFLASDSKFCSNCGAKVEESNATDDSKKSTEKINEKFDWDLRDFPQSRVSNKKNVEMKWESDEFYKHGRYKKDEVAFFDSNKKEKKEKNESKKFGFVDMKTDDNYFTQGFVNNEEANKKYLAGISMEKEEAEHGKLEKELEKQKSIKDSKKTNEKRKPSYFDKRMNEKVGSTEDMKNAWAQMDSIVRNNQAKQVKHNVEDEKIGFHSDSFVFKGSNRNDVKEAKPIDENFGFKNPELKDSYLKKKKIKEQRLRQEKQRLREIEEQRLRQIEEQRKAEIDAKSKTKASSEFGFFTNKVRDNNPELKGTIIDSKKTIDLDVEKLTNSERELRNRYFVEQDTEAFGVESDNTYSNATQQINPKDYIFEKDYEEKSEEPEKIDNRNWEDGESAEKTFINENEPGINDGDFPVLNELNKNVAHYKIGDDSKKEEYEVRPKKRGFFARLFGAKDREIEQEEVKNEPKETPSQEIKKPEVVKKDETSAIKNIEQENKEDAKNIEIKDEVNKAETILKDNVYEDSQLVSNTEEEFNVIRGKEEEGFNELLKQVAEKTEEEKKQEADKAINEQLFSEIALPNKESEKFFTFNKKNEEFQALLDKEYERIQNNVEEGGIEDDISKFMEVHTGPMMEATEKIEEMMDYEREFFNENAETPDVLPLDLGDSIQIDKVDNNMDISNEKDYVGFKKKDDSQNAQIKDDEDFVGFKELTLEDLERREAKKNGTWIDETKITKEENQDDLDLIDSDEEIEDNKVIDSTISEDITTDKAEELETEAYRADESETKDVPEVDEIIAPINPIIVDKLAKFDDLAKELEIERQKKIEEARAKKAIETEAQMPIVEDEKADNGKAKKEYRMSVSAVKRKSDTEINDYGLEDRKEQKNEDNDDKKTVSVVYEPKEEESFDDTEIEVDEKLAGEAHVAIVSEKAKVENKTEESGKEKSSKYYEKYFHKDKRVNRFEDFIEDESNDGGSKRVKIFIKILIILLIIMITLVGIRIAKPDLTISYTMDKVANAVFGIFDSSDEEKTEDELAPQTPSTDKTEIVENAKGSNYKDIIGTIQYTKMATWNKNDDYEFKDLADAKDIQDNIWYEDINGKVHNYDADIVAATIEFTSKREAYINDEDKSVSSMFAVDSPIREKTIKMRDDTISKTADAKDDENDKTTAKTTEKEEFGMLEIGDIKVAGNFYYIWTIEHRDNTIQEKIYKMKAEDQKIEFVDSSDIY